MKHWTLANTITIIRLCLIPVFVGLVWAYGHSLARSQPVHWYRLAAIAVFAAAACGDGLDGFVARRFKQESRLGSILDPIADKGLVAAALLVLALAGWRPGLPIWFLWVVIGRDVILVAGFSLLTRLKPDFAVRPSAAGKASTAFQLATILCTLLSIATLQPALLVVATALTIISGAGYVLSSPENLNREWTRITTN